MSPNDDVLPAPAAPEDDVLLDVDDKPSAIDWIRLVAALTARSGSMGSFAFTRMVDCGRGGATAQNAGPSESYSPLIADSLVGRRCRLDAGREATI